MATTLYQGIVSNLHLHTDNFYYGIASAASYLDDEIRVMKSADGEIWSSVISVALTAAQSHIDAGSVTMSGDILYYAARCYTNGEHVLGRVNVVTPSSLQLLVAGTDGESEPCLFMNSADTHIIAGVAGEYRSMGTGYKSPAYSICAVGGAWAAETALSSTASNMLFYDNVTFDGDETLYIRRNGLGSGLFWSINVSTETITEATQSGSGITRYNSVHRTGGNTYLTTFQGIDVLTATPSSFSLAAHIPTPVGYNISACFYDSTNDIWHSTTSGAGSSWTTRHWAYSGGGWSTVNEATGSVSDYGSANQAPYLVPHFSAPTTTSIYIAYPMAYKKQESTAYYPKSVHRAATETFAFVTSANLTAPLDFGALALTSNLNVYVPDRDIDGLFSFQPLALLSDLTVQVSTNISVFLQQDVVSDIDYTVGSFLFTLTVGGVVCPIIQFTIRNSELGTSVVSLTVIGEDFTVGEPVVISSKYLTGLGDQGSGIIFNGVLTGFTYKGDGVFVLGASANNYSGGAAVIYDRGILSESTDRLRIEFTPELLGGAVLEIDNQPLTLKDVVHFVGDEQAFTEAIYYE